MPQIGESRTAYVNVDRIYEPFVFSPTWPSCDIAKSNDSFGGHIGLESIIFRRKYKRLKDDGTAFIARV